MLEVLMLMVLLNQWLKIREEKENNVVSIDDRKEE